MSMFKKLLPVILMLSLVSTASAGVFLGYKALNFTGSIVVDDRTPDYYSVFESNSTSLNFGTVDVTEHEDGLSDYIPLNVTNIELTSQPLYIRWTSVLPNVHLHFTIGDIVTEYYDGIQMEPGTTLVYVYATVDKGTESASDTFTVTFNNIP